MNTWIDPVTGIEWATDEWEEVFEWNELPTEGNSPAPMAGFRCATLGELQTLIDVTKFDPAFRAECPFQSSYLCWTADKCAGRPGAAWTLDTEDGRFYQSRKHNHRRVLLVKVT